MAAGDIIIPNNTVTPELMQKIATEVQKLIAAGAKEPSQYEEVKSLANLTSLPALMQTGSAYRLVRVAVEILKGLDGKDVELQVSGGFIQWRKAGEAWNNLVSIESLKGDAFTFDDFTPEQLADLKKPATDAAAEAQRATTAATQATQAANTAAGEANKATGNATEAATVASTAAGKANEAIESAKMATAMAVEATNAANEAVQAATDATTKATEATQAASTATSNANQATQDANTATEAATTATTKATEATTKATEATAKAATATTNAEGATQRANDAAGIAEELNANPPKPVAGNWHKYNTETSQYEDTGIQAKGDPGQSFKIVGQYATLEELQAAIPDGSQSEGVYAVGAAYPYHYYAWINVGGVWQWADQGQLQGAEGKSAFEVWKELPGNAEKSEQDYLVYLQQPATEAAKQADAATARANTAASDANKATTAATTATSHANKATEAANSATTQAQQATSHANTATDNANKATTAANEAAQAANDAAASIVTPDIDHVPTEADTTYQAGSETHHYRPGDECRYFDPDLQEYVFYKLHDLTPDGKAVWQEAGSGGKLRTETILIRFASNQADPGADFHMATAQFQFLHWDETVPNFPGTTFVEAPDGEEFRVVPNGVKGYRTPGVYSAVANAKKESEVTLEYFAERIYFEVSTSSGGYRPRTVVITDQRTGEVLFRGLDNTNELVLIPFGTNYKVTIEKRIPGHKVPVLYFTAAMDVRYITLNYDKIDQTYITIDLSSKVCQRISLADPNEFNRLISSIGRVLVHPSGKYIPLNQTDSRFYSTGEKASLDGTKGNVMVLLPSLYYIVEKLNDSVVRIGVTRFKPDDGYRHIPQSLIGAFKGHVAGGKLQSVSGVKPTTDMTYDDLLAAARANGNGWGLINYWQHCLLAILLWGKFGRHDVHEAIGKSLATWDGNNITGSTITKGVANTVVPGPTDTQASYTAYNSALGVEGIFGCVYEFMEGIELLGDTFSVTDPDGRKREIAVPEVGTGWIRNMAFENSAYPDLLPMANGASSSTVYGDYCEMAHSEHIPLQVARSCFTASDPDSFSNESAGYINATKTAYQPSKYFGTRLAYTGTITSVLRVEDYEALFV